MSIIIPSRYEQFRNWLKGLRQSFKAKANQRLVQTEKRNVIWSKPLDKERWIEVIARDDNLMSFTEFKKVKNGEFTYDIPLHESGLYSDIKEITQAVTAHMQTFARRPN